MNVIICSGKIIKEPSLRKRDDGTPVCSFTIEVDRNYKNDIGKKVFDYFPCTTWGNQALWCSEHLSKEMFIELVGSIYTGRREVKSVYAFNDLNEKVPVTIPTYEIYIQKDKIKILSIPI